MTKASSSRGTSAERTDAVTSRATLDESGLELRLDRRSALLGLTRREVRIARAEIVSTGELSAKEARRLLRWRVAGAAIPGWWLMGWFGRTTRDGRWAWAWITPKRRLVAIETTRRRRSLMIVPRDWFVSGVAVEPIGT